MKIKISPAILVFKRGMSIKYMSNEPNVAKPTLRPTDIHNDKLGKCTTVI